MKCIDTAPHEFAANLVYSEYDLDPYFGCDSVVKQVGGSTGFMDFERRGEKWQARLRYESSNILPPTGGLLPSGRSFDLEEVREFRLRVRRHPEEDGAGEQKIDAHLAPRWSGMEGENGAGDRVSISVPDELEEGINVRVQSSNIEFERVVTLVRRGFETTGINGWYFERPSELSNIQDAERYVRVHTDESGPIHARDGPLARMGHLLESDRQGYRKTVQNDTDQRGRTLPGYYHTVTFGQRRVREAWPHHDLPREIKHYYAREALSKSKDEPLRHPKLGVSYQTSRWDETLRLSELEKMNEELDEAVISVLRAAGLCTHATDQYVSDAYFEAELRELEEIAELDLDQIQHEQENVVIRFLADGGFSPVEEEAVATLLADGGEVSPQKIALENGRHVDSVRRALRRIDGLLERSYGKVALRSSHIAGMVHGAIQEARDSVTRALRAAGTATRAVKRGLDEKTSSFLAWAEANGIDHKGSARDARLELRMGEFSSSDEAYKQVAIGFKKWLEAGRDESRFRGGRATFTHSLKGNTRTYPIHQILGSDRVKGV
jgi:hypothetical protein